MHQSKTDKPLKIPQHVAIIMDGNGRWARQKFLPRQFGHKEGVNSLKRIVKHCVHLGIKVLTVYAFSTENWARPEEEVSFLMSLMEKTIHTEIQELDEQGVRIRMIGDRTTLSQQYRQLWERAEERTHSNNILQLNIAFNYGGRNEIVNAARSLIQDVLAGKLTFADITEQQFSNALYTQNLPDPDLIIRTGGEYRMSNFLLWQAAYAEWYFTDVLWPDFGTEEFEKALESYTYRERRFGRVLEK